MKTRRYPELGEVLLLGMGSRNQQWVADHCGVSQVAVNNWVNGYTRPRPAHLVLLASLLHLDLHELAAAAGHEPEQFLRLHQASQAIAQATSLESIKTLLTDIRGYRRNGDTVFVKVLPNQIKLLEKLRGEYPADKARIDRLIAIALVEWLDTHKETVLEDQIEAVTQNGMERLNTLTDALKDDPEDYDMATRILLPSILYVAGKMEESATLLRQHINQVTTPRAKAICVRDIAVATALLADQGKLELSKAIEQFRQAEEDALKVAGGNSTTAGDRANILTGLGFGYSLLGLPKAQVQNLLGQAMREHQISLDEGTGRAFTEAQIARTDFYNLTHGPEVDPQATLAKARRAISLLERSSYNRQRKQIINRLLTHPDTQLQEAGEELLHSA